MPTGLRGGRTRARIGTGRSPRPRPSERRTWKCGAHAGSGRGDPQRPGEHEAEAGVIVRAAEQHDLGRAERIGRREDAVHQRRPDTAPLCTGSTPKRPEAERGSASRSWPGCRRRAPRLPPSRRAPRRRSRGPARHHRRPAARRPASPRVRRPRPAGRKPEACTSRTASESAGSSRRRITLPVCPALCPFAHYTGSAFTTTAVVDSWHGNIRPRRRERLLDAAIELVGLQGLTALTHRAVDAAAGVPTGTASNYWRTRRRCSTRWWTASSTANGTGGSS